MKKEVILFSILFLILITFSVSAQNDLSKDGYKCLEKEIDNKGCSQLSLEEKIFSVLSTGKCKSQLLSSVKTDNCFGSGTGNSCDVKETAQAIIALKMQNSDVTSYIPWLLNQTLNATGFDWLLQIDALTPAACLVNISSSSFNIQIHENDKLTMPGHSPYLRLDSTGYWIKIDPRAYGQEIEVSCNESFSTTLLFKKGQTTHILDTGLTGPIKINSPCFKSGTSCDYEDSLWATFALGLIEEEVSPYLPYLVALKDTTTNKKYLPESFLYYLTDDEDYSASLVSNQRSTGYWQESGNRYYDTALALMPLANEATGAKNNATIWLEDKQDNDGCWNSKNIIDTAFLLFSIWPESEVSEELGVLDCEDQGNYCMSSSACSDINGTELNYSCFSMIHVCCSEQEPEPTCSDVGGTICESDEVCDVNTQSTSDTSICCTGTCEEPSDEISECEDLGIGFCKGSCESGEEINSTYECLDSSEFCCVTKIKKEIPIWIWISLFVVLFLAAVIFLFRKKIFKKKQEVPTAQPRRSGMPPRMPPRRPIPQRRVPPQQKPAPPTRPIQPAPVKKAPPKEDVFKKLKEMSK